jgi:hypothetical protein
MKLLEKVINYHIKEMVIIRIVIYVLKRFLQYSEQILLSY